MTKKHKKTNKSKLVAKAKVVPKGKTVSNAKPQVKAKAKATAVSTKTPPRGKIGTYKANDKHTAVKPKTTVNANAKSQEVSNIKKSPNKGDKKSFQVHSHFGQDLNQARIEQL